VYAAFAGLANQVRQRVFDAILSRLANPIRAHMAVLTELFLYPIKSCAGIAVREATLAVDGLSAHGVHDREWMVVGDDGQFLTQREFPCMAVVTPRVNGQVLEVSAPGVPALELNREPPAAAPLPVDCGDAAASWFSQVLGSSCRLVRFRPGAVRPTSTRWTGGAPAQTRFADGYPLLLIGAASLADLNTRLAAAGRAALPMNRFRPNLVVDGIEAFEEDYVASFGAGTVELRPVKPCARCPIPAIDQATGLAGPDPLDILQTYRARPQMDGAVCVGMNCIVASGAGSVLRIGQELDVMLAF
jgi:uncharacterized protein YcbX